MLLTSGQVSIALSSAIVFFFTLALFLSGYAIQQRTLREIRAAIKAPPKPSPKIFLPDRFKQSTTELEDGTIIIVDDPDYESSRPPTMHVDVEVKPTEPESDKSEAQQEQDGEAAAASEDQQQQQPEGQDDKDNVNAVVVEEPKKAKVAAEKSGGGLTKTTTPWWRRPFSSPFGNKQSEEEKLKAQKPMSRAERRKRIREEIMKLAQGDGETGVYQRRLY
ncbi:hypothetical protein QBC43DRAFT_321383 [Cladorrhinum sp. PSN259]|nr:hypothetical protein QBC43DRAFT_321383 [Cladorrhinum sp. PSN259]